MNKINNPYLTFPINKPFTTIIVSIIVTALISVGVLWIKIDDDFVKMFPDDIKSKVIWDEIQEEFGSTEQLVVAFGDRKQTIENDQEAFSKLNYFIKHLNKLNHLVDYVVSINNFSISGYDNDYQVFSDYSENQIDYFMNDDRSYIATYIVPKVGINNARLVKEVNLIADKYLSEYDIHFAGQPYLTGETPSLISKDVRLLMLIGIVVMLILLSLNLRSVYSVMCVFITIILCLISMVGFMGWMYFITGKDIYSFTILSTSMPIILLTIANSDGVHIVARFKREMRVHKNPKKSINNTLNKLRAPIFLTSLTTAIAFLSMVFSPIPHMLGYGVVIAFGVIWAWLLSTTLLPSLIIVKKWDIKSKTFNQNSFIENQIKSLSQKIINRPKKILVFSFLVAAISFIGIWFIKVEVNVIKFFKEDTSIRESTDFIDNEMSGSMNLTIRAKGDFENMENILLLDALEKKISEIPNLSEIKKIISYPYIVREAYKIEKESFGEFNDIVYPTTNEELEVLYTTISSYNDSRISSIINEDQNTTIISAQMQTVSTQKASDISDLINSEISQFKKDFNTDIEFETTGLLVFLKEFVSMVVQSALISISISIFIIFIVSFIFYKKFSWAILSIIPLLTAIILNFGIMGLIGVELSHLTALLTSIIIGVGVDFSIHYISDYRHKIKENVPIHDRSLKTSQDVGYPIMLDVVSNLGFIALLFSAIIPLNYMGALMVFAMISTSFGALTILSSIIEILKRKLSV